MSIINFSILPMDLMQAPRIVPDTHPALTWVAEGREKGWEREGGPGDVPPWKDLGDYSPPLIFYPPIPSNGGVPRKEGCHITAHPFSQSGWRSLFCWLSKCWAFFPSPDTGNLQNLRPFARKYQPPPPPQALNSHIYKTHHFHLCFPFWKWQK